MSALSFSGEHLSVGDRLSHFRFYWAVLALGMLVVSVLRKRWIAAVVAGALLPIHAFPVVALWMPGDRIPPSSENKFRLNVVSANLYANNARKSEAVAKLMELFPDVLVLLEVSPAWRPALAPVVETYPHKIGMDGSIWLLSRHPLRLAQRTRMKSAFSGELEPLLEVTAIVAGSAIRVVAIHAPRPTGAAMIAQQRNQANDYTLALNRDKDAPHRILIGDFNTSPFSGVFRHIVQTTGLKDTSKGRGYHPTWGPRLPEEPLLPWLGIPIDHAFVSERVAVMQRRVEKMPGSDHRYQQLTVSF